jgi:DNA processing protein
VKQDYNYYLVALTLVPGVGDKKARLLLEHFQHPKEIFKASKKRLKEVHGIGDDIIAHLKKFDAWQIVDNEIKFTEKHHIQILTQYNNEYPKKLLNFADMPLVLYYRGEADLNAKKMISIVGTRAASDYGKLMTEGFVTASSKYNVTIISGMAYGIDAIAHKTSVKVKVPTIGVLAHGLDRIYPTEHKLLAKEILQAGGGLLTEFMSGSKPDKHNFPKRNRIVAGLCDALIVAETGVKGGSMLTAHYGMAYKKVIAAFPGRATDKNSMGCNTLIKNNIAHLIHGTQDVLELMKWSNTTTHNSNKKQRSLFYELTVDETCIIDLLEKYGTMQIDAFYEAIDLSPSKIANVLLSLELKTLIQSLPGKKYQLIT